MLSLAAKHIILHKSILNKQKTKTTVNYWLASEYTLRTNPISLGDQPNKCDTRIIHFRGSFILIVKQDGFDEKRLNASYGKQRL